VCIVLILDPDEGAFCGTGSIAVFPAGRQARQLYAGRRGSDDFAASTQPVDSKAGGRTWTVVVQENTTDVLLRSCTQGEIDLAIIALPVPTKYLEVDELFEEELLLVLPPDHPLADKSRIRLSDVEPFPFVLLDEAHCLSDNIVSFCRQRSFQPVTVERTSQLTMVQELVSLSHGISMIPAMAQRCDQSDRRVYRSLSNPKPMRTIAVVWNPYRFESRLLKAFREHLR